MNWGMIGAGVVMGIAALGSAIGIGIAGQGAIGYNITILNSGKYSISNEDFK